jgi:arylsulfatase A-like enzyme
MTCWKFVLGMIAFGLGGTSTAYAIPERPNIVIVLADDLGYGDIGAYGADDIETPHIDALGERGIRFTDFYAGHNVCSPSRAALLTGRHSHRMGISHVFQGDSPDGMPLEEVTIAEMLRDAGYATGMVGKWHLGSQDRYMPWNQGFDEFHGVPYSNDMGNFFWYDDQVQNYEPIDQAYLTQRYTVQAQNFIEAHKDEPFFLYLAHNMPHVPIYASPDFLGTSERGLYGDVVQELDWSVGQLVASLDEAGILENTLIIFTSDNGPWLAMGDHGGEAGGLRDGKGTTFDGGHRVPMVASLGGGVSGVTIHEPVSMLDMMPTIASLTGAELPVDRALDGRDVAGMFTGEASDAEVPYYYYAAWNTRIDAVRLGNWKLKREANFWAPDIIMSTILQFGEFSHEEFLFDLSSDPGERENLISERPEIAQALRAALVEGDKIAPEYRLRVMSGVGADRAGYGRLFIALGGLALVVLLLFGGLIFGLWRGGKTAIRQLRT